MHRPGSTRRWRRIALAAATLALLVGLPAATVVPAAAAPATITLAGHGWGHGRGMGQYGAQGYATMHGWNSAQILNHYYGTTVAGTVPNETISVRLTAYQGAGAVEITSDLAFAVSGFVQSGGNAVVAWPDPNGGFFLQGRPGCGAADFPGGPVHVGSVLYEPLTDPGNSRSGMLRPCGGNAYRGTLRYTGAQLLNHLPVESYLRSVVPRESPSWFAAAALQAQSVAARSYAIELSRRTGTICDTISCQVYSGAFAANGQRHEATTTDAAIVATAGLVRTRNGVVMATEFSSSTGGYTAGGTFPAVVDEGDAVPSNPRHNWTATLNTADLAARYGVGSFVDLRITDRNGLGEWGGRVRMIQIVGTTATVTRTGDQFRIDHGLFSNWFIPTLPLTGSGPALVSRQPGHVDVFVGGRDSSLWHLAQTPSGSGNWMSLGGALIGEPTAASWDPSRLDVFVRGTDNRLWHRPFVSSVGWWHWEGLGGSLTSAPAATSWAYNRIDVFGRGGDGGLWGRAWLGSAWGPWYGLGGSMTDAPAVASPASGRLEVAVRGSDGQLYRRSHAGGAWAQWEALGGAIVGSPTIVAPTANRLLVFAQGLDRAIWLREFDGSWLPWRSLGGGAISPPGATDQTASRIDVMVGAPDGWLWASVSNGGPFTQWFRVAPYPP